MLSQCNTLQQPSESSDYSARYKRDLYDDLQFAIGMLKAFDAEINALHPSVAWKIKLLMRE